MYEDENTLYFKFKVSQFYIHTHTHTQNILQTPNTIYCTDLLVQREFRSRVYDSKAIHHAVKEREYLYQSILTLFYLFFAEFLPVHSYAANTKQMYSFFF